MAGQDDVVVHAESFATLYLEFLYPGGNVKDNAQNISADVPVCEDLNTLNPLTWRKVARRIVARGGILVLPAWTFFAAPCLGWVARYARLRGVEVVTIVHNVRDHEAAGWKNTLIRWQLSFADRFVTHSEELKEQLRFAVLRQPCTVIEHPVYSDYPPATGCLPRQRGLELLCFGLVRPYKGVDIALRALAQSELTDFRLTIAGEIWEGEEDLRRLADDPQLIGKVEFRNGYQSDNDAAELFDRADAVILPYRAITGSGVLAMARHYRCPVVASDLPPLVRAIKRDHLGWTFPTEDSGALARLIVDEISRTSCMNQAGRMAKADSSGWSKMAGAVFGQT